MPAHQRGVRSRGHHHRPGHGPHLQPLALPPQLIVGTRRVEHGPHACVFDAPHLAECFHAGPVQYRHGRSGACGCDRHLGLQSRHDAQRHQGHLRFYRPRLQAGQHRSAFHGPVEGRRLQPAGASRHRRSAGAGDHARGHQERVVRQGIRGKVEPGLRRSCRARGRLDAGARRRDLLAGGGRHS